MCMLKINRYILPLIYQPKNANVASLEKQKTSNQVPGAVMVWISLILSVTYWYMTAKHCKYTVTWTDESQAFVLFLPVLVTWDLYFLVLVLIIPTLLLLTALLLTNNVLNLLNSKFWDFAKKLAWRNLLLTSYLHNSKLIFKLPLLSKVGKMLN